MSKGAHSKSSNTNLKRKSVGVVLDISRNSARTNAKKERFIRLLQQQRETEQDKNTKRKLIRAKRQARKKKRAERNKAWCKLTKKGQPIMKERIQYMLKELGQMRQ